MTETTLQPRMSELAWLPEGLEPVTNCPVCDSASRHLLHEGLSDRVFFVAPGEWTLWQCAKCRSAWLDPRPNEATIGIAYQSYYTHEELELPTPGNAFQRLRAKLGNGYRNSRYGTRLSPSSSLGKLLAALLPPLRWPVDAAYRFLPSSRHRRVLDIGCSNGAWLDLARGAGWHVSGVEPDPVSRRQALDRGIEVRESVAAWLDDPLAFDYVTISHVIEHVHDPIALLHDSYALLRPGGGIYIDTPNIDALGHEIYGRDWLGLDPPRHLVLFNRDSLKDAVSRSGFQSIQYRPRIDAFPVTTALSRRIAAGLDPFSDETSPKMTPRPSVVRRLQSMVAMRRAEFLTLTAIKPL